LNIDSDVDKRKTVELQSVGTGCNRPRDINIIKYYQHVKTNFKVKVI